MVRHTSRDPWKRKFMWDFCLHYPVFLTWLLYMIINLLKLDCRNFHKNWQVLIHVLSESCESDSLTQSQVTTILKKNVIRTPQLLHDYLNFLRLNTQFWRPCTKGIYLILKATCKRNIGSIISNLYILKRRGHPSTIFFLLF